MTFSFRYWLASGVFLGALLVLSVLMFIPQAEADSLIYTALGAGFVLFFSSLITFLGIKLRQLGRRGQVNVKSEQNALRQGLESALLIVGGIMLWAFNGLTWWELGFLIATVAFAEIALVYRAKSVALKD
ncbi:hypothetical protein HYW32_03930 [Candidatus Berkelbacteria bacterium]|nr:hypothetical protein [Candidatus Berkelbacteria bacterium]